MPDDYTFGDLHHAIQKAMGWNLCHMHQFTIMNPTKRKKEDISSAEGCDNEPIIEEYGQLLSSYFSESSKEALYEYVFGDRWEHKILFEEILPLDPSKEYPICLAGERACPPEDCGGILGYEDLLENLKDPDLEERSECVEEDFDPEVFDPQSVFASQDD